MRAKTVLIYGAVSDGLIYLSPSNGLFLAKPVKHFAYGHWFFGADKKVPVIWHQAVRKEVDLIFLQGLRQDLDDLLVIKFMKEHLGTLCGTVANVNDSSWGAVARFSRHIGYNC